MARNNNNVPIAVGVGAIVWLYSPLGAPTRAKVAEWYAAQTKVVAGKKLPPSLGSTGSTGSTGVTVPGLVPLGPGAGRYQPATDYSWLSNPAAYPPGYYPPYNGVPTGRPNQRPGTRVASDPATGRPVGAPRNAPVSPPIVGLPPTNIRDPYLEPPITITNDTYGGSFNPWAGSATQYLDENFQPTGTYDFASTLPSGSVTQYLDEQYQEPANDNSPPPEAEQSYSSGDGFSSNNQTVSYDEAPPAYEPPEAPAYEPVDPPAEDYGGSYNPYDQGQPDETYGGGDNPWTDDVYNNRGE